MALFFDLLVAEFSPDPRHVLRAADGYRAQPTQENLLEVQRVVAPPRQELFHRLNMAPGGTATLVAIRRGVLKGSNSHPEWRVIDADLVQLFRSWFNPGFLKLERIDWRTPAIILEQLIHYEAVHEIASWTDLRRRLEADRRCFAFFHPALPEQPIIFIEVALTKGISAAVQPLLDLDSPVTGSGSRGYRDVLLDHQLSRRPARHTVWQFADQKGGPGARPGVSAHQAVCHLVAGTRLRRLAHLRQRPARIDCCRTGGERIAQVARGRPMVQTQA
jgi:hypothetical protein